LVIVKRVYTVLWWLS